MSLSDDPNAPQIEFWVYLIEKGDFAGDLIGLIFYGIAVALFFQCVGVLLSPRNSIDKRIKWALLVHIVTMFTFLTIPIGIDGSERSDCYIDNRNFPGNDEYAPGPLGCGSTLDTTASATVLTVMFPFNQWLADGLLLYRCYAIYLMSHWAMVFPCLMYLASVAMGIVYIYQGSGIRVDYIASIYFTTAYFSICLTLNVILTLMIVIRLLVHIRNLRKITGSSDGSGALYTAATTVVTMLIESYALYAVALLLYIVPWAVDSWVLGFFAKSLGSIQVISPYLIILRVAKRRALTSNQIASGSGNLSSINFKSQGESAEEDNGTLPDGNLTSSADSSGEPGVGAENAIEEVTL